MNDTRISIKITKLASDGALSDQLVPHMEKLGSAVGARMQRLVPKRTWALHDTISTDTAISGSKVTTTIGFGSDDVSYAMHVERGTSTQAAQPYARPALLQTKAGDLNYSGKGVTTHGIVSRSTRRQRTRNRRTGGRS